MRAPPFRPFGLTVLLTFTGLVSLHGQESQDTTRLAELVVTPTRLPTPPDAVVSSVTVITGDDLRARGVHFVQDALREVPGAAVVQGGSFGAVSSLFLRGERAITSKCSSTGYPRINPVERSTGPT